MSNYFTDDEKKLVVALQRAGLLVKVQEMVGRRLALADKGLRVQIGELVFRTQGRAQELDELLTALSARS